MADDTEREAIQSLDVIVFLDECVGGSHVCICQDVRHLPGPKVHLVKEIAPQGLSDRRVMLHFFRLIKLRIFKKDSARPKFIFLTKDQRFVKAVAREERSKINCQDLKIDPVHNQITKGSITIHICKVKKTSCPIQKLNEFIAAL